MTMITSTFDMEVMLKALREGKNVTGKAYPASLDQAAHRGHVMTQYLSRY